MYLLFLKFLFYRLGKNKNKIPICVFAKSKQGVSEWISPIYFPKACVFHGCANEDEQVLED